MTHVLNLDKAGVVKSLIFCRWWVAGRIDYISFETAPGFLVKKRYSDPMPLSKAQIKKWRALISRNKMDQCLEELEAATGELPPSLVNMVLHFRGRYEELKKQERLGTLSYSSASTERNKIVMGVLELLDEMERELEEDSKIDFPSDLSRFREVPRMVEPPPSADKSAGFPEMEEGAEVFPELELEELEDAISELEREDVADESAPPPAPSQKPKEEGAILYRIPHRMQLEEESRCVVRLAFDEKTVKKDLEDAEDIVVKSVRVEEVMEVELLDPNEENTFRIRPITDQEQLVEADSYTEWIFKVKPLREGTFPLLLKISVILFINGKDRKKNIVLEEMVEVATVPVGEAPGTSRFKTYDPTFTDLPGIPMFISWSVSTEDAPFKEDFEKQLSVLRRNKTLHFWDKSKVPAGEMTDEVLRGQLSRAALFAVLISPDYLSDDACYQELAAIHRQEKNREAAIVPILVRSCSYELLDIGRLQILPRSGTPIAQHDFPDEAWKQVIGEIHKMAQLLAKAEELG